MGGGEWLNAFPSPKTGTLLTNEEVRISVGLRLGAAIVTPHFCINCGASVTAKGHHGLSCSKSKGRFPRHERIKDLIARALRSSGLPCRIEPVGLLRSDHRRPDGETLIPWSRGKPLAFDVTCCDFFAPSRLHLPDGAALIAKEQEKERKYHELSLTHRVQAIAADSLGRWGPSSMAFLEDLCCRLRTNSCDPRAGSFLLQRLSIAICQGNRQSVSGTLPGTISQLDN